MAVDLSQLVGGALGGAVASSVLGPWIAQSKDRRDVRAEVLRQLALVEQTRWAGPASSWETFRDAVHSLRAAALIAAVPRDLVDRYIRLATIARRKSEESAQLREPEDNAGGIVAGLSDLPRDAAWRHTDHLWHPRWRRWRLSNDLSEMDKKEAAFRADDYCSALIPSTGTFGRRDPRSRPCISGPPSR